MICGLLVTSTNDLKKNIGRLIVKINSEILEFLPEQKKVTEDVLLSTKGASLKGSIEVKKMELEDAFAGFEPVTSESETVDIGEVNKGEEEASKIVV